MKTFQFARFVILIVLVLFGMIGAIARRFFEKTTYVADLMPPVKSRKMGLYERLVPNHLSNHKININYYQTNHIN